MPIHYVPQKSTDNTRYDRCPNCGDPGVYGPFDTTPSPKTFMFHRSWYCRLCWWKATKELHDDVAAAKAATVAAVSNRATNG